MLFDNTQIFLQVFLEMIGASHTDFRQKDKNWKSDEFVGLHIVCGWVLGLSLHFSCTFFRQKPGKCNHASKVATTLIANRLLAPKTSRSERNLPKNHTFRSFLAYFLCQINQMFHLLYNKTSAEYDCFRSHSAEVLLFLCEMITSRVDGRFPLCHHHRLH